MTTKPRLDPMEDAISGPATTTEQKALLWRLTAWAILALKRLVK
jgi:hypothetical protein